MPRLFALLAMIAGALLLARTVVDQTRPGPSPGTFRAKRSRRQDDAAAGGTEIHLARSDLAQVRDALTGAPLALDDELFRCARCDSFYGVQSVRGLANDNAARCVSCGSTQRLSVIVDG